MAKEKPCGIHRLSVICVLKQTGSDAQNGTGPEKRGNWRSFTSRTGESAQPERAQIARIPVPGTLRLLAMTNLGPHAALLAAYLASSCSATGHAETPVRERTRTKKLEL
jgi:hypothetical protein